MRHRPVLEKCVTNRIMAAVKKIPAASVLRDAVHAYVLPFRNNPNLKKQFGSEP